MNEYDAIIVGGGPAGLAASIAAARAGLSVLVADVRRPPVDKLCGEGILPAGLAALQALGVDVTMTVSHPFDGISFHEGDANFSAAFTGHAGLGMRRTRLHALLVDAACREGVTQCWQTRAEWLAPELVRVGNQTLRCRYVIGADGQRSLVRVAAKLSGDFSGLRCRQRLASGSHYACAPWSRFVQVYWCGRTQAYVTPVSEEEIGVAFISDDPALRPDSCLSQFPALRERLAGSSVLGKTQGATSLVLRLPRVVSRSTLLVGEAAGSVDAITGEGLSLLLQQAVALGAALGSGDLLQYQRRHRRIMRRPRLMSRLLLSLSAHPRWRARVFHAFQAEPRAFENLLAIHTGERPRLFGTGSCIDLGAKLLLG